MKFSPNDNYTSERSDSKRRDKERMYELFAQVARAMSSPHRLELLDLLVQAPRTVQQLSKEANMKVGNTSQHLQRLKQARLVAESREGVHITYSIADNSVARLWLKLREVGTKQLAEVEQALDAYRNHRHDFVQVSAEEIREKVRNGKVTLIDVRPMEEYRAGHLPGARSLPLEEVESRLSELPPDRTVVAYCRGPYCVFADEALQFLQHRGYNVARLEDGVAEWQELGYELEK
ncbi:MAG: metalloregulator ArsR/SmtB family transcription factor [candidate division Zixibacteria bacterium]|nr:metalloregulator ArsR/SmtB family transcription factor [candidate division Zixibacteria bacterium]NIW41426.1 metalloregulator ArsR/SmtB family transcription factor [candidate division Zixibacteria bacterium]NIW97314.1 metalloregulator ArsR/SmtB family transcription factor [Phycisphaerae bacterium]